MNLDNLIDQIRAETIRLSGDSSPESDAFRQQVAVSLLSRVPILLSSAVYSSLLAGGTPPQGLENTLALGAGICGHHVMLTLHVLRALAVPARDVQVFYSVGEVSHDHTVVEVKWGGAWRMVDVTWGFIPHRGSLDQALGFQEAARLQHREGLHHSVIPWRRAVEDRFDIFGYLTDDTDALFIDGHGTVHVSGLDDHLRLRHPKISRAGSWQHIGDSVARSRIEFTLPPGSWTYEVTGSVSHSGSLSVAGQEFVVESGEARVDINLTGPDTVDLDFVATHGLGYFTLTGITKTANALQAHQSDR